MNNHKPFPAYESDYAQHLLRLDRVAKALTDACLHKEWQKAVELNKELDEIRIKLDQSLQTYIEWETPSQNSASATDMQPEYTAEVVGTTLPLEVPATLTLNQDGSVDITANHIITLVTGTGDVQ